MVSTVQVDAITAKTANGDLTILNNGTGKVVLPTDVEVGEGVSLPTAAIMPGQTLQTKYYDQGGGYWSDTTGAVPYDDTPPQDTEGGLVLTQAITPLFTTSLLLVEAQVTFATSANEQEIMSLFRDGGSAIQTVTHYDTSGGDMLTLRLIKAVVAGSLTETTFTVRVGHASTATIYFGGISGGRKFGGVASSCMTVKEISQ